MRIGLVGFGHGGRFFHAPLIASLPGVTFAGVVTRSPERRQLLANEYPGVPAWDSLGQLVEAGVDLLVISTPLHGRPELVMQAIELGVPVVSDKPFAADTAQAEQLVAAAQRQNVLLSVYQNRRWDSDYLTIRKLLDAGALGQVSRFESFVERFAPDAVGDASGGAGSGIWAATWLTRRCSCSARCRRFMPSLPTAPGIPVSTTVSLSR